MMDTFQDRFLMLKDGKYKDRLDKKIREGYFKDNLMLNSAKVLKKTKLSFEDMGALVGVTKQSAMSWGKDTKPKSAFIYEYARIYDLPVDWLLGTSDVNEPKMQQFYAPFEELGFSYEAYQNLLQLKQSGKDMKQFMQGINYMLEYKQYAPIARREYYDIIDELNNFFSLYPNGTGMVISDQNIELILNQIKENTALTLTEKTVFPELLSRMKYQNASTLDNAAIASLNDHLKKCKAKLVADAVTEYEFDKEDIIKITDSQKAALYNLNLYYNPESVKSIYQPETNPSTDNDFEPNEE